MTFWCLVYSPRSSPTADHQKPSHTPWASLTRSQSLLVPFGKPNDVATEKKDQKETTDQREKLCCEDTLDDSPNTGRLLLVPTMTCRPEL